MVVSSGSLLAYKRTLILIAIFLLISPLFGVFLADMVGYHEPLDLAAEALELPDLTETMNWTPFLDYSIPNLPAEVGYIIAGLLGVGLILGIGFMLNKLVGQHQS